MSSFTLYVSLLPELCVLVARAGDPLVQARLAMTCHTEDRRRREWYWRHMSGRRNQESLARAIVRYGTDAEVLGLLDGTWGVGFVVNLALAEGRDRVVLDSLAADGVYLPCHCLYRFNSRAAAHAAAALIHPPEDYSSGCDGSTQVDIDTYWDFRDGLREPLVPAGSTIVWALRMENRAFLLKYKEVAASFLAVILENAALVSDDFFEFLVESGWLPLGSGMWPSWKNLGHLQVALRRGVSLADCRILWSRHTLARDAWLAAKQNLDIAVAWRSHTVCGYAVSHAREWIDVMEYHGLPWTAATLWEAISDGDYAAVVWHLKQPTRAADGGKIQKAGRIGDRLRDDLLANGWLTRDPLTNELVLAV